MTVLPPPPDQPEWDKAAVAAAVGSLTAVRATAEKWVGTVTALLGIFSSVAVIGGTDKLTDIRWHLLRWLLVVAIGLAGLCAGISIFKGAKAAQAAPATYSNWNGSKLRSSTSDLIPPALAALKSSRRWGIAAAALVFVVGLATLISAAVPDGAASSPSVLVIDGTGGLLCGQIEVKNGAVSVANKPITKASQVVIVKNC
jgi:hypothetical protein